MSGEMAGSGLELNGGVTRTEQTRHLKGVLDLVRDACETGLKPVVEIDLDLTALMPISRTRKALAAAAEIVGIELFRTPESLPILPGYSDAAWISFVQRMDLAKLYPNLTWSSDVKWNDKESDAPLLPYTAFHEAYWTSSWMADDTPTPGLGSFVDQVRKAGGETVFISGRWLEDYVEPSLVSLRNAGISDPKLVIGNDRHPSLFPPAAALSDAKVKVQHQLKIEELYGLPVAIIDDRAANRAAIIDAVNPAMRGIAICIPGFTYDPASDDEDVRISTFEFEDIS